MDKFITKGLLPQITVPTRFTKKGCTLIDQIYCKFKEPLQKYKSAVFATRISDHFPCIMSFDIKEKVLERPKFITVIKKSEKHTEDFCNKLKASCPKRWKRLKKKMMLTNATICWKKHL